VSQCLIDFEKAPGLGGLVAKLQPLLDAALFGAVEAQATRGVILDLNEMAIALQELSKMCVSERPPSEDAAICMKSVATAVQSALISRASTPILPNSV